MANKGAERLNGTIDFFLRDSMELSKAQMVRSISLERKLLRARLNWYMMILFNMLWMKNIRS